MPWLIATSAVAALLYRYPLDQITEEMKRGDVAALVPFAIGMPLVMIFPIAAWDFLVMRSNTMAPLRYFDVLRAKAGATLLVSISYSFSQGGYGLWLARKTRTNARTSIGVIFYIMGLDLAAICAVASLGVFLSDVSLPAETRAAVGTIGPAVFLGTVVVSLAGPKLLPRFISDPRLLKPWHDTPASSFALSLAGRCFNIFVFSVTTWAAAVAFGLELGFNDSLTYMPIIMLVGSLPVNVLGFGAVQASWLLFESPAVNGSQLLAFQFLWQLLIALAIALRGAPFVSGVLREIRQPPGEPEPEAT